MAPDWRSAPHGSSDRLMLFAGVLTWAMIALRYVAWVIETPSFFGAAWLTWSAGHLAFGVLLVLGFRWRSSLPSTRELQRHRILLVLQTLCALVAIAGMQSGLVMILLVIVATQVPLYCSLPVSIGWVLTQTAIAGPIAMQNESPGRAVVEVGTQLGFQLFGVYASTTAVREREARAAIAEIAAELLSTRELLASSSRLAERRRISRELHDLMGHHLTALSLQLEAAGHQAEGPLAEQLGAARRVATELLGDVRQVVRTFRTENVVDLAGPLRTLAEAMPRLAVHLELPDDLAIEDPVRANAILRSVQEVVTNAARHARADNLWIALERSPTGIAIRAHDDGRGARTLDLGAGLTGLRERLEELGGRLDLDTGPGRGFRVEAALPLKVHGP